MFHMSLRARPPRTACLDLRAADVLAETERLTTPGGQQIRSPAENNNRWISWLDPEGNEFDLVEGR